MNVIRQGDLVMIRVNDAVTDNGNLPEKTTLAVGEDSGHAHVANGFLVEDLFHVPEPTTLRVEPDTMAWRHDPIPLDPGVYRFVIQREYTPAGARRVQD